ncbi:MAG: SLC13 family permease [Anaerolineales bacterium]|jgi:di/tricarboxylate transporter
MSIENILVLIIIAVAVVLFVSERLRVDVVAMLVLTLLIITGLVTVEQAFSGFSSPAVITVLAVFIVSGGLTRSGVADQIGSLILRVAGTSQMRMTLLIMVGVGVMSAFMNNIGAVAILLPAVMSVSRKTGISPSKLLIPLAWASLMGGNMTLIGTPPNILASSILENYGNLEPFSFFDFTPMGIIVLATGTVYMLFIGRHLLPDRAAGGEIVNRFPVKEYLTELEVQEGSPLVHKTLREADLENSFGINVIYVHMCCQDMETVSSITDHRLEPGDELTVEASAEVIMTATEQLGLAPTSDREKQPWEASRDEREFELAELVLSPRSELNEKTIRQIDFRSRYGLSVLAIQHEGVTQYTRLGEIPIEYGDVILVEGPVDKIGQMRRDEEFLFLEMPSPEIRRIRKAPIALAILLGTLVVISAGWLHVSAAMFIAALMMVLTGTLKMEEAYNAVEWKSVFLIACMLPLGLAMENTGTARLLADQIIRLVGSWGVIAVLVGIYIMTSLLTEVMSNAAATVLAVPIAIDAALELGVDPHTFVIAVVIAASTSFLMPVGHQVNVLVYGPGGYRFSDYTKVGLWLNLLLLTMIVLTLPLIWPF